MDALRDAWFSFEAAFLPELATLETEVLAAMAVGVVVVLAGMR